MSFVLYAFLQDDSPPLSPEGLMARLNDTFGKSKRYSSRYETNPFTKEKSVRVQWDRWSANLTYGEGDKARSNAQEAQKRLGGSAPEALSIVHREIHVFFADDRDREYTTEAVEIMGFLEGIEGAIIFDPQQNKLLNAGATK